MFLYDERLVLVRYEKNTMVLPNEDYEARGYQPKIADLPTKEDWLKQFDANGEYTLTPKRPRDPNQLAKSIIDIATGQKPDRDPTQKS